MNKQELQLRICDLFNYVQSVRNDLLQIDGAIDRLKFDVENNISTQIIEDIHEMSIETALSIALEQWEGYIENKKTEDRAEKEVFKDCKKVLERVMK